MNILKDKITRKLPHVEKYYDDTVMIYVTSIGSIEITLDLYNDCKNNDKIVTLKL